MDKFGQIEYFENIFSREFYDLFYDERFVSVGIKVFYLQYQIRTLRMQTGL
jgi:hypothetical protein